MHVWQPDWYFSTSIIKECYQIYTFPQIHITRSLTYHQLRNGLTFIFISRCFASSIEVSQDGIKYLNSVHFYTQLSVDAIHMFLKKSFFLWNPNKMRSKILIWHVVNNVLRRFMILFTLIRNQQQEVGRLPRIHKSEKRNYP